MPLYPYRCTSCRDTTELFFGIDEDRPKFLRCQCGGTKKRKFSFSTPEFFEPHYNYSVGSYVTSKRDMQDKMKASAAERSERLGIPHDYSIIDRADVSDSDVGVDEAGMRETHDQAVKDGRRPPTGKLIL